MKPYIIAFEGVPGVGKSTLIRGLMTSMKEEGIRVRSISADDVPEHMRLTEAAKLFPRHSAEHMLLMWTLRLAQARVIAEVCEKAEHDLILLDRFWATVIAFDVYGHGVPMQAIKWVEGNLAILPHMTIFLQAPLDCIFTRKVSTMMKDISFATRVHAGYTTLAQNNPSWKIIDASGSRDSVHTETQHTISNLF